MSVCLGYLACRVILSPVACLAVPYSSHYIIYSMIFGKKLIETSLNKRGIERRIVINIYGSLHNVPIIHIKL